MKLRNKKTGDIVRVEFLNNYQSDDGTEIGFRVANTLDVYSYASLAELNAEWEDYEEQKDNNYWYIDGFGRKHFSSHVIDEIEGYPNNWMIREQLGNYLSSWDEAEKAVEKLKAWKRLRDKGFRFDAVPALGHCDDEKFDISIIATMPAKWWYNDKVVDDIHYVFGGEE